MTDARRAGLALDAAATAAARRDARRLVTAVHPWAGGGAYCSGVDQPFNVR